MTSVAVFLLLKSEIKGRNKTDLPGHICLTLMCVIHPINLLWLQLPGLNEHSFFFFYIDTETKLSWGLAVKKGDLHYWLCIRFVYKRQGILIIDIYTGRSMQLCRKCIHCKKEDVKQTRRCYGLMHWLLSHKASSARFCRSPDRKHNLTLSIYVAPRSITKQAFTFQLPFSWDCTDVATGRWCLNKKLLWNMVSIMHPENTPSRCWWENWRTKEQAGKSISFNSGYFKSQS